MRRKPKFSLPSKYVLMVVTILCIGMLLVTFTTDIAAGPLRSVAGYVLVPIQNGINNIGLWFSDKADNMENTRSVMAKNKELQAQVDELTISNKQLQQDKFELDRLRDLYLLDQKYPSYKKVAARVIGKDPGNWFSSFMIDKGSKDGLKVNMNVIAGSGLVGRIISVESNHATVRSIIDDASNVTGMIASTSDRCNVEGDLQLMNEGLIRFSQLTDRPEAPVSVGAEIVTSNISDKYLEGISIGYIKEITTDSNNLTKSGYVTPVVDFKNLQEVLVITQLKN